MSHRNPNNPAEVSDTARQVLGHYHYEGGFRPGSFTTRLIEVFEVADPANTIALSGAFPVMGSVLTTMSTFGASAVHEIAERGKL